MDAVLSLVVGIVPAMLVLLNAFAAALLGLAIIVVRRRRINVLLEIEYRLWRRGYLNLVKPVRAISKAFTPEKEKKKEIEYL